MASQAADEPSRRRGRATPGDWRFLWGYLRQQPAGLLLLGLVLLVGTGLQLAAPLLLRQFIDVVPTGQAGRIAIWLAVGFVAVSLTGHGFTAVETAVAEEIAWRSTNQLRQDTVMHCMNLDVSFHLDHSPGELVERVDGDIGLLSNLLSRFVVAVASQVLLILGILIALAVVEWRLSLLLAVLILLSLAVLRKEAVLGRRAYLAYRQTVARLMGFLEERIVATEDLQSSDATGHTLRRFGELNRGLLRADMRAALVGSSLIWASSSVLISVATASALYLAAMLSGAGAMTLGTVYLVFVYVQQIQAPLIALSHQLQDYQRALAALTRVRGLLAIAPEATGGRPLPSGPLAVRLDEVTFSYRPGQTVLDGVSFDLPPGSTLGVVGRTGGGKTTIARLLVGLYHPGQGSVHVGEVSTRDADLAQLRDRVALVTQDVHLFSGTVRDNVTLYDRAVPDAAIAAAISELGLGDWLRGLPNGLDTVVGDGGLALSAGQSQLLALTRVFATDPGLVILDEASARLDPVTERLLDTAISRLLSGRTAVVIAHRLATLRQVDQILVVEHGRVLEYGSRADLARDAGSRFRALLTASEVTA